LSKHSSQPGWLLDLVIDGIDQRFRGFAGDLMRAGAERLQVCSAYLAVKPPARDEMHAVGEFLSTADHASILSAAYGDVPKGFRRALARIGATVQDQRCYSLLYETLSRPPSAEVLECIYRMHAIDRQKLVITRLLPPTLARPNVVNALAGMSAANSVSLANDVATAYELMVERGVDREALAQAICRVRSERELMNLWSRWIIKCECPPHPISDRFDTYVGITSGAALKEASARFKNCAADRYMLGLIEGTDAFSEFQHDGKLVMVHLRLSEDRWTFEGVFGPRNSRPSSAVREALVQYLKAQGVVVPGERRKQSQWQAIARLSRAHLFDFEFE
jgi:hypothetical protein